MNLAGRIWRRYTGLGVTSATPRALAWKIRLSNQIVAFIMSCVLGFGVFFAFQRRPLMVLHQLALATLLSAVPLLNWRGHDRAARFSVIALFNFFSFIVSSTFGREVGSHLPLYPTMALPLILLLPDEKRLIAVGVALPFVVIGILAATNFSLFLGLIDMQVPFWSYSIHLFLTLILLAFVLFHFYGVMTQSEREIAARLDQSLKELSEHQQQLIHASKMSTLGEMASGIAHEINNPLAIIELKSAEIRERLTLEQADRGWMEESLTRIEATTERIARIIRSLNSLAREGDDDPMKPVDVRSIVEEALGLCRERFRNHSIELRVSPIPEILITCRSVQISQVLLNLLSNSFDAIQSLDEKWIEISAEAGERELRLSVTDSGSGIPPELREKVLQPFFTTKETGKGTGLGLSISKGLVESHGGRLWIDASASHTRFVISLPLSTKA